jgi:hypothetical protein
MTLTRETAIEAIQASPFAGCTLTDVAKGYAVKKTHKDAVAYLAAKAMVTSRKRWLNAHKAAVGGDDLRMAAYAAEGRAETNTAWAEVRKAESDAPAKPKASKPKAKAKAPVTPKADNLDALAEQLVALDDAAFTKFTAKLISLKTGK